MRETVIENPSKAYAEARIHHYGGLDDLALAAEVAALYSENQDDSILLAEAGNRIHKLSVLAEQLRIERDVAVKEAEAYRAALREILETLTVPAAEYVPVIADAFAIIHRTMGEEWWKQQAADWNARKAAERGGQL